MKTFQFGTIVFAVFAILSAIVCIIKGFVPFYGIEAFIWAGLAAFWHVKKITNKTANLIVLSLALAVLLGNGFNIGRAAGYKSGYTTGNAAGDAEGHAAGYKEGNYAGYEKGYDDGIDQYLSEKYICDDHFHEYSLPDDRIEKRFLCADVAKIEAKHATKLAQSESEIRSAIPQH
jgi:hypothetical protein